MRSLLLIVLLAGVLCLTGCQSVSDYVVTNETNRSITLEYKLKLVPTTPGKYVDFSPPAKTSLHEFKNNDYRWQEMSKNEYQFDNSTGTIKVEVGPNEVVRIESIVNDRENEFGIASIKIEGTQGSVSLDGHQAQVNFHFEDKKYVLRYR